jgi:endonuclease VIII
VRVVLENADWQAIGYRLPIVELLRREDEHDAVGHLGPDLLGPDWDEAEALRRLRADPSREVADALLDQRNLAGIGNLYKSELCFLAGVHPRLPVGEVPDLPRLVRRARAALMANKDRVEQTLTGDLRKGRQTWVYRRDGQPCRRCGTPVLVDVQGPRTQERATYWCPTCQPEPEV